MFLWLPTGEQASKNISEKHLSSTYFLDTFSGKYLHFCYYFLDLFTGLQVSIKF